jgi:hypothetical protein
MEWHIVVGGGMVGLENATWDDVVDEIREKFGLTAFRAVDVIDRYTSICVQSKDLEKIREEIEKQRDRYTKAELEALNYLLERTTFSSIRRFPFAVSGFTGAFGVESLPFGKDPTSSVYLPTILCPFGLNYPTYRAHRIIEKVLYKHIYASLFSRVVRNEERR